MATNRLLNERMPEEEFKKLVQEYIDYICANIPLKHPIKVCKIGPKKQDRIEAVLKHLMNTRSVYKPGLALVPYSRNIEKHTLPENINAEILAHGTKALGYIGSIIDDTTTYPPYPKGDSYCAHINKKLKIACTYGTFAIYDGYVYLACHVDDNYESYLYVPVQSISWNFNNPVSLLLYELLYYGGTTMLARTYETEEHIMQLKPTNISYLVPLEFCQGLILYLDGTNWCSYHGLQSVWSMYNLNGVYNAHTSIETCNFANIFKDSLEAIKIIRFYLSKYEKELTYMHTRDLANRDQIVNIITRTRQNFEDILSEFDKLRINTLRIILTYFDGSILSVIKIMHELLKYAYSKFGSLGTSRLMHDNVRLDDNIYQFDDDAILRIMRPLHELVDVDEDDLNDRAILHIVHNINKLSYSGYALKNLNNPYLQLVKNIFMPGPIFLKIIQQEFIRRGVVKYTVRNGIASAQFDTIKILPSIHTKRYLDNVLDPTLAINFSKLTPTYARLGNQDHNTCQKQYCAKSYIDMESLDTPERDAFKMFKATQPVPPDQPDPDNDDDDFLSAEEVEECVRKAQVEYIVNGVSLNNVNYIRYEGMDGLHPFAS